MAMKKLLSLLLSAAVLLGSAPAAFAASEASDSVIEQVIQSTEIMVGDGKGNMNLDKLVTRAEYAKMLVAASSYKDKVAGSSNSSPFKDVPYTNWAAGYIKTAVQQGWLTGYLDGSYKPSKNVTLEEAATGVLKLLGYTTEDFSGSYPSGQLALYKSLSLNTKITATQGTSMTRRNMMYLFYNLLNAETKDGKVYAQTLGYTLNDNNEIDYLSIVSDTMEGPYVVGTGGLSAIVSTSGKTVYRNGYTSSADAVRTYDVVYYTGSTIWAYANAVTGTYQEAKPSAASPTSVVVAGNTYEIETSDAAFDLSTLGGLNVGDIVTLLLGRDGKVAAALSADEYSSAVVGMVTATGTGTYYNAVGNAYTARTITITATDGNSYVYPCTKSSIDEGDLVSIGFGSSETDVSALKSASLRGKVSGYSIGNLTMAKDVRILDVNDTSAKRVYYSRLNGATLESSDVRYYKTNSKGEITDLILKDFTGDLYVYGLITGAKEESGMGLSGTYTYYLDGEKQTISTSGKTLGATYGPARMTIENGQLSSVTSLSSISSPDSITLLGVSKGTKSWLFADECAVYLSKNATYSLLTLTELRNNFDSYSITCYYDHDTVDGGRIRLVIVKEK